MLVESYIGGVAIAWLHSLTYNTRKKWRIEREVNHIFNSVVENGLREDEKPKFEMSYFVLMDYGLDLFINCNGSDLNGFLDYMSELEYKFEGRIVAESILNGIRAKVWLDGFKMDDISKIKFNFGKCFNKIRNTSGETFKVKDIKIINKNRMNLGYTLKVGIPNELSYDMLCKYNSNLDKIGVSYMKWNKEDKLAEIEIITSVPSKVDYKPIKTQPWELYFGLKNNYDNAIVDYKISPNTLIVGSPNTGKTRVMMQGILNCIANNDNVELAIATMEKEDLRIFKNKKHCKYYANNLAAINNMIDLLIVEMEKRNKLLNEKDMCFSIFDYNEITKNKMTFIHLLNDEISDIMSSGEEDSDHKIKSQITEKIILLGRKGRSVGIYLTFATQRSDSISLNPRLKALLCNQIIFSQTNEQSAKLILGDDANKIKLAVNLNKENREFLYNSDEGFGIGMANNFDNNIIKKNIARIPQRTKELIDLNGKDNSKVVDIKDKKLKQNSGRFNKLKAQ